MILTFLFTGGAEGARTPDLMTASHALSQLSYSPKFGSILPNRKSDRLSTGISRLTAGIAIVMWRERGWRLEWGSSHGIDL